MSTTSQTETTHSTSSVTKEHDSKVARQRADRPTYAWGRSFKDWFRHAWLNEYSDEQVEKNLLSALPFYPESDGKRRALIINTDIGDGKFIHEFFIENIEPEDPNNKKLAKSIETRDVVLVHGYAASLGLFVENFDALSSIPGIRIHAIDLLGFGFSARPTYPSFSSETKQDIYENENWFIDSIEEWRKQRGINKFVLMGHSFGGYLSCAYALKYKKQNFVEKLVLISPVGLTRSRYSISKSDKAPAITKQEKNRQEQLDIVKVELDDQEKIVNGESDVTAKLSDKDLEIEAGINELLSKKRGRLLNYMWANNLSIFSLVRNMGPARSKMISGWTTNRFASIHRRDPQQFQYFHDYIYRTFNGKGSGEYALTRILAFGALPRFPLLDRCPQVFSQMNLPTLWMFGDDDWMDEKSGLEMANEINKLANKKDLAEYAITPRAGHHLYLDNPTSFTSDIFNFLGLSKP